MIIRDFLFNCNFFFRDNSEAKQDKYYIVLEKSANINTYFTSKILHIRESRLILQSFSILREKYIYT